MAHWPRWIDSDRVDSKAMLGAYLHYLHNGEQAGYPDPWFKGLLWDICTVQLRLPTCSETLSQFAPTGCHPQAVQGRGLSSLREWTGEGGISSGGTRLHGRQTTIACVVEAHGAHQA